MCFRNGVYPLTAFAAMQHPSQNLPRAVSPDVAESVKSAEPERKYSETRLVTNGQCQVRMMSGDESGLLVGNNTYNNASI